MHLATVQDVYSLQLALLQILPQNIQLLGALSFRLQVHRSSAIPELVKAGVKLHEDKTLHPGCCLLHAAVLRKCHASYRTLTQAMDT